MSGFKATQLLFGMGKDSDDDDDDAAGGGMDEEPSGGEEEDDNEDDDSEDDSDDDDDKEAASKDARDGAAASSNADRAKAKKREREWLASKFIAKTRLPTGSFVYKSTLLADDKVFFSMDKVKEFASGKRYKGLVAEMKKGLRTENDNKRLRAKAQARRERHEQKSQQNQKRRRQERNRQRVASATPSEIQAQKDKFQAKKARRLARKMAEAAADDTAAS